MTIFFVIVCSTTLLIIDSLQKLTLQRIKKHEKKFILFVEIMLFNRARFKTKFFSISPTIHFNNLSLNFSPLANTIRAIYPH